MSNGSPGGFVMQIIITSRAYLLVGVPVKVRWASKRPLTPTTCKTWGPLPPPSGTLSPKGARVVSSNRSRLEGCAFQTARRKRYDAGLAGKPEVFRIHAHAPAAHH